MDVVIEVMQEVGLAEEVAEGRTNWKLMIRCGDS